MVALHALPFDLSVCAVLLQTLKARQVSVVGKDANKNSILIDS